MMGPSILLYSAIIYESLRDDNDIHDTTRMYHRFFSRKSPLLCQGSRGNNKLSAVSNVNLYFRKRKVRFAKAAIIISVKGIGIKNSW